MTPYCEGPTYEIDETRGNVDPDSAAQMVLAEGAYLDACEVKLKSVQDCINRHGWVGEEEK